MTMFSNIKLYKQHNLISKFETNILPNNLE